MNSEMLLVLSNSAAASRWDLAQSKGATLINLSGNKEAQSKVGMRYQ